MKRLLLPLAAAALAAPGAAAPQGGAASPASQANWLQRVERTQEGGFRIGNPNARIKLVEYFSLTCPHCATFSAESGELFEDHVRRGQVSVEYRNYVLNSFDVAAALLSRCAAPSAYFDLTHSLLASQRQWVGRAQNMSDAQRAELGTLQPMEAMQRLANLLGLPPIAARHGLAPAQVRACFANRAGFDELERILQGGNALGVEGTPTFFLNGRKLDVNTWRDIRPLLGG